MVMYLHQDAVFTKQLKGLRRAGGIAAQAAGHARDIIEQLLGGGICSPRHMSRLTRNGEARIKDSFKFDLVGGYRMLGVFRDGIVALLFLGSHDECDHWIKNNAGLETVLDKRRNQRFEIREAGEDLPPTGEEPRADSELDYDERLLSTITEQDLRAIFCGLCGK